MDGGALREKLCFAMQELQIFFTFAESIMFKHRAQVRSSLLIVEFAELVWNLSETNHY